MKQYLYLIAGITMSAGLLTACSSSDDNVTDINPTPVTLEVDGQAMEDLTASMQGTVYNALNPTSRAVGNYTSEDLTNFGIPTEMPAEPTIPSDAVELLKGVSVHYDYGDQAQWWISHPGTFYVAQGSTVDVTNTSANLTGMTIYVAGTLKLKAGYYYNACTIYVLNTGELDLEATESDNGEGGSCLFFNNTSGITVYNYGTINKSSQSFYIAGQEKLYNKGTLSLADKDFKVQGVFYTEGDVAGCASYDFESGCHVNILGNLDMSGKDVNQESGANKSVEGYIHVGGTVKARNLTLGGAGVLYSDCGIDVTEQLKTNSKNNLYCNYVHAGSVYQCSNSFMYIGDGGFINIDGTYENENNGNDAGIVETGGTGSYGLVKAGKIFFNSSGSPETLDDIYFFKTPNGGKIGVDCSVFEHKENESVVTASTADIALGGTAVFTTADQSEFHIAKGSCGNPGYGPEPDPTEPDNPSIVVVGTQHTHDISATCVAVDGNDVYLSFHKRGDKQSGCLERLAVSGDKLTLKQFIRDKEELNTKGSMEGTIDFNHLCLSKDDNRVYVVGNNKKGGFLGYIGLKDNGDFDVEAKKMGDLDSVSISRKLYEPLKLVKLRQAEEANSSNAGSKKGGDGNAVIVNGDVLQVASTYGFEFFNKDLQSLGTKPTAGKGKHIAFTNMGKGNDVIVSYFTKQVTDPSDTYEAIPLKIEKYAKSDQYLENSEAAFDANDVTPNNGKNTIAEYDGKIYSCQGARGLYVYDASNGSQIGHYKETFYETTEKNKEEAATTCANGVAVDNNYVYIAYGSRGLVVLNRADLVGEVGSDKKVTSFNCGNSANYVALAGDYIYVAYGRSNIKVFKLVTE